MDEHKIAKNAKDISALNSNLSVIGNTNVSTVSLDIEAAANQETEYTLIDGLPNGTYIISAYTHVDNAPIPEGSRLFCAIASRAYTGATLIAGNSQTWQWNQTIIFKGTGCTIRFLPEYDFACEFKMSLLYIRIR